MCHLMITTLNVLTKGTFSSLVYNYVHHSKIKTNAPTDGHIWDHFDVPIGSHIYIGVMLSVYIIIYTDMAI